MELPLSQALTKITRAKIERMSDERLAAFIAVVDDSTDEWDWATDEEEKRREDEVFLPDRDHADDCFRPDY